MNTTKLAIPFGPVPEHRDLVFSHATCRGSPGGNHLPRGKPPIGHTATLENCSGTITPACSDFLFKKRCSHRASFFLADGPAEGTASTAHHKELKPAGQLCPYGQWMGASQPAASTAHSLKGTQQPSSAAPASQCRGGGAGVRGG